MAELATAYISIVPETSKIAPGVRQALGQAERQADSAGKSMGGKMSSALGTALKAGAASAAAAGVATIGTAMVKGFQRLQAIDDAKGKLEGLGHTAQAQSKIMESALQSVKGTAYGLGDAATIAASAVATGIKPGQELTKHLTMIGDAASIAGVGLNEMGSIFTKIQNGGRAYMGDLNQLADRGIPIYEWLGKAANKSGDEIMKMASKGQVSAQMVYDAINTNIGGAAQAAGKTVRGSFNNMIAALGRLGAAAQQPFFDRLPGMFAGATGALDALTPKITELAVSLDRKIFEEWGPKIRDAIEAARDSGALDGLMDTLRGLADAAMGLAPSLGRIMTELGRASASIGVSTWQLFLTALNAAAGVLNTINPLLSATASLMEKNQWAVTAMMAAWVGFKTVPGLVSKVSGPLLALSSRLANATSSVSAFGGAYRQSVQWMAQANPQMSRAGVHMAVLRANGVSASGAMNGLKSAGSSLAGVFGGPLAMGVTAAAAALAMVMAQIGEDKAKAQAAAAATKDLADSHRDLGDALRESRGQMSDDVWASAEQQLEKYRGSLEATADTHRSTWERVKGGAGPLYMLAEYTGLVEKSSTVSNDAANAAMSASEAFEKLGQSNETVTRSLYGSSAQWETLKGQLNGLGEGGQQVAGDLQKIRSEFEKQRNVARQVAPGVSELAEAMKVLGDSASSAADKSKALKAALDSLNPARSKSEALAQHNQVLRDIAQSSQEAIDQTQGFGEALLSSTHGIDTATANGAALRDSLLAIVDASAASASQGEFTAEMQAKNAEQFSALAKQYGLDADQIRAAADKLGYDDIELVVSMSGAEEVEQQLAAISKKWNETPNSKTIKVNADSVTDETRAKLEAIGAKVSKPMDGLVTITANDKDARNKILDVSKRMDILNGYIANPKAGLDASLFDTKDATVRAQLEALRATHVEPVADLAIQKLLDGASISKGELDALSKVVAKPSADMDTAAIKAIIDELNRSLDHMARPRVANIEVATSGNYNFGSELPGGGTMRGPGVSYNANGAIVRYAQGGIAAAEAFANGGLKAINKPTSADIFAGRGAGTIFAEEETGGEAYIPLATGKRKRSTDILATVADMFGLAVVPKDSLSGTIGAIAGGAVSGLLGKAGLNVTRFADGGFSSKELRELAEGGHGASQPLTGAPYVWGGVNWGDCSGAMSAFTRAAVGLPAFGGRWSTGSAAGDLATMGAQRGTGTSGDMRIGYYNGGEGGGHTAGTLPDGTNVEMGGGNGGGMLGGSVGANSSQFTDHWFIPVGDSDPYSSDDYTAPDTATPDRYGSGTTAAEEKPTTISGLAGNVAASFVSGQVASLLGVLGIGDSPPLLSAWSQLEIEKRGEEGTLTEDEKKRGEQDAKRAFEDETVTRKRAHEDELAQLKADLKAKKIDQAQHDQKATELKRKFEDDERERKRAFEDGKDKARNAPARSVRDPGTHEPKKGEDTGTFDLGGIAPNMGWMAKATNKPERVLSPRQTDAFEQMVQREFQSGIGTDKVIQRLDELVTIMREKDSSGGDTWNISTAKVEDAFLEAQQQQKRSQAAKMARW